MAELVHQLAIAKRLFNRIEVSTLDILDNCDLKNFSIVKISNQNRQLVKLRPLSGPPTAFTRNDLILISDRPNDQGLNNTLFLNRISEIAQIIFNEILARLIGVRNDFLNWNQKIPKLRWRLSAGSRRFCRSLSYVGHQCRQSATQSFFLNHLRLPYPDCFDPWCRLRISFARSR